jgi:hypothetical protein
MEKRCYPFLNYFFAGVFLFSMKNRSSVKAYLALYNEIQALGWLFVLISLLWNGFTDAWTSLGYLVSVLQAVCLLEVANALLGLWGDDNGLSLAQRLW